MNEDLIKRPSAVQRVTASPKSAEAGSRRNVQHIRSEELFAGASEVHIEHGGALYRLQRTSLGKLILTK